MSKLLKGALVVGALLLGFLDVWMPFGSGRFAQAEQAGLKRQLEGTRSPLVRVHQQGTDDSPAPVQFLSLPQPRTDQALASLRIDFLDVRVAVVEGSGFEQLMRGVGHDVTSGLPGEGGTVVLVGHQFLFGAPFRSIEDLPTGELIRLDTRWGTFTYEVAGVYRRGDGWAQEQSSTAEPSLALVAWRSALSSSARPVVMARLVDAPVDLRPILADAARDSAKAAAAASERAAAESTDPLESRPLPPLRAVSLSPRGNPRTTLTTASDQADAPEPPSPAGDPAGGSPAPPPEALGAVDSGLQSGSIGPRPSPDMDPPEAPEATSDKPTERSAGPVRSTSPGDGEETTAPGSPKPVDRSQPACSDGLDNDGDGLIDFRAADGSRQDRQCNGHGDDDE